MKKRIKNLSSNSTFVAKSLRPFQFVDIDEKEITPGILRLESAGIISIKNAPRNAHPSPKPKPVVAKIDEGEVETLTFSFEPSANEPIGEDRGLIILHEMERMIDERTNLTRRGAPELPILNQRLEEYGIEVTSRERNKLFKEIG